VQKNHVTLYTEQCHLLVVTMDIDQITGPFSRYRRNAEVTSNVSETLFGLS